MTAAATPPGSFYYVWQYQWCYNGWAAHDCDGPTVWYHFDEGQDLTAVTTYMYRQDYYVNFRVSQYAYQNGPLVNSGEWDISGAGVCSYPQGCPGGGGGMYAGVRRNTVYNDTTGRQPGPDPSARRMQGNQPKGGK